MNEYIVDIHSLPLPARVLLAQELWDSIYAHSQVQPLSPQEQAEVDRRIAAADAGDLIGIPAEQVLSRLLSSQ